MNQSLKRYIEQKELHIDRADIHRCLNQSLTQYIEQRELSLLYTFNNLPYFEDQLGNVVSLKQIEKDYFNSLKILHMILDEVER